MIHRAFGNLMSNAVFFSVLMKGISMRDSVCMCVFVCVCLRTYVNGLSVAPEKGFLLLDLLTHCQTLLCRRGADSELFKPNIWPSWFIGYCDRLLLTPHLLVGAWTYQAFCSFCFLVSSYFFQLLFNILQICTSTTPTPYSGR